MGLKTGLVYSEDYLRHETGLHPENPERLRRTIQTIRADPIWDQLELLKPRKALVEQIAYVHDPAYIEMIEEACSIGRKFLDADTVICSDSYKVALLAAGGVLVGIDTVVGGQVQNAFCLVRPPGHHAEPDQAMGFCLFNNVAIGARYAQREYSLGRIAIIDWDLHHGNGTQIAFYTDPSVFYISFHQYPYYPGTGTRNEVGSGEGRGYTLNLPMLMGSGNEEYLEALEGKVLPQLRGYQPELILISAGFDAHQNDPLGGIRLTNEGYYQMTKMVVKLANESCGGRIVSTLEGGYNLDVLPHSVIAHLRGLLEA